MLKTVLLAVEQQLLKLFDQVMEPQFEKARREEERRRQKALAAPRPPPVVEIERTVVRIDGKQLTLPSSAARWIEVLGPATMPWRDLPERLWPVKEWDPACVFVWDHLGIAAAGTPARSLQEQSPDTCSVNKVEVFLDRDEGLLLHPPDEVGRARRPKQSFPGTLIVEGLRIKARMKWLEVYHAMDDRGIKCNPVVGSSRHPKIDVPCWTGPIHYYGQLIRNSAKDPRTLWGFTVEYYVHSAP